MFQPMVCRALALHAIALVLAASVSLADAPTAIYLFPAGGQRGTTVHFRAGGYDFHDGVPVTISGEGVEISNRTQRAPSTVWFEGPVIPLPDSQAKEGYPGDHLGTVKIAKSAGLGMRQVRMWNSQGISDPLRFVVGDLPECVEHEIDGAALPVAVSLPITINGRIFPREDVDIWTFQARAGQSYVCEVMAARFGSPLESHIVVVDPNGRTIAENSEHFGNDACLRFTAAHDGTHQVRIKDANHGGLQHFVYRLTITDGPYVESIFPLGGRKGTKVAFQLSGQNISPESITFSLPEDYHQKLWHTEFVSSIGRSNSFPIHVSNCDERIELEPNDSSDAIALHEMVRAPIVLNGRIDNQGDVDRWRFSARKGESLDVEVFAARLGSRLDSVIAIRDSAGKEFAMNDDAEKGLSDSKLTWVAPTDGNFELTICDRFDRRVGTDFAYRLQVTPSDCQADFQLQLAQTTLNLSRGGQQKIKVAAIRKYGMNAAIELKVNGLPEGVKVEGNTIAEKKNQVEIVFRADSNVCIGPSKISIVGQALVGDQILTRVANQSSFTWGEPPAEEINLAIALPTPFKIAGQFETKYAARGSTFIRHYRIDRGGFDGPITVSMAERQVRHLQGVTGPTIVIPPGTNEFDYPIHLPPWMEIGRTSRTCLMGVGEIVEGKTVHKVSFTSPEQADQIIVLVDPGQLNLRLDRDSVRALPSSQADLQVSVGRGPGLTGAVRVDLVSPAHIQCISAAPLVIPAGENSGRLILKFGNLLDLFNMPMTVQAQTLVDGHPYTAEAKITIVE